MTTFLIVISIITVYLALALIAAPKLMRLVYRDNLFILNARRARHDEQMEAWRAKKDRSTLHKPQWVHGTELDAMHESRRYGFWLSLAWPTALAYYRCVDAAFKQEIAAQQAKANTKIIADYERLLAEKFDQELASANPTTLINRLTRKAQK